MTADWKRECIYNDRLPLAVYREIAAHLRQVEGVKVSQIAPDPESFDYALSQVKGLAIEYPAELEASSQQQLQAILDYYARTYAPWQRFDA